MTPTRHIPVMPEETLAHLGARPGGVYLDGTFGGGGHASLILGRGGSVIGLDRDPDALARARERFPGEIRSGRLRLARANHADLAGVAGGMGCHEVDGVLLDLGISSDQLDDPARGFGFQHDGPLDMRMDPADPAGAADLVATASEGELAEMFRGLGGEPQAKKFARAIARERVKSPVTLKTTAQLAALVGSAAGGRCGRARHPATRVFQALRMAVNRELESLGAALEAGVGLLAPGRGRMVVITFEGGTALLVKQIFQRHAGRLVSLQQGGSRWEGTPPAVEILTRRAAKPSEAECRANPRSRSATLRAVRRLGAGEPPFSSHSKQGAGS